MNRSGKIRITGGNWRGRSLSFPDSPGLRPTPDMARQRLFNWLGQDLAGMVCLDLFAGSGALGFEAASRGASRVVMVERDPAACAAIQRNCESLQAGMVECRRMDVMAWLAGATTSGMSFDLVLVDPPYAMAVQEKVLMRLPALLKPGARVYVEHDGTLQLPAGWSVWRENRTGHAHYCLAMHEAGQTTDTEQETT